MSVGSVSHNDQARRAFEQYALPPASLSLAAGAFDAELGGIAAGVAALRGYPPALLPVLARPNGTILGWWVDPFGVRDPAVVECRVDDECRVVERFRSWDQLALALVVECMTRNGDAAGRSLARGCGADVGTAARIAVRKSEALDFRGVVAFDIDPPWQVSRQAYRGGWPFDADQLDSHAIRAVAGAELTSDQQRTLRTRVDTPPWLTVRLQSALFPRLVAPTTLDAAWRCLNSPGWRFEHVRHCLQVLTRNVGGAPMQTLAEAWLAAPHEEAVGFGETSAETWWGAARHYAAHAEPLPAQVMFACGSEQAPDSRFGAQLIVLKPDGSLEHVRRQHGRTWHHSAQVAPSTVLEVVRMLAATPFPAVLPHHFPPGATAVTLATVDQAGQQREVTFDQSQAPTAVYWEVVRVFGEFAAEYGSME